MLCTRRFPVCLTWDEMKCSLLTMTKWQLEGSITHPNGPGLCFKPFHARSNIKSSYCSNLIVFQLEVHIFFLRYPCTYLSRMQLDESLVDSLYIKKKQVYQSVKKSTNLPSLTRVHSLSVTRMSSNSTWASLKSIRTISALPLTSK